MTKRLIKLSRKGTNMGLCSSSLVVPWTLFYICKHLRSAWFITQVYTVGALSTCWDKLQRKEHLRYSKALWEMGTHNQRWKRRGGVSPQQTSRERRQFCFCIYYILDQDMKQKLKQKKTCIYKRMNGKWTWSVVTSLHPIMEINLTHKQHCNKNKNKNVRYLQMCNKRGEGHAREKKKKWLRR